jgi:hypothetical protein
MHYAINKNQQEAAGSMRRKGLAAGCGLEPDPKCSEALNNYSTKVLYFYHSLLFLARSSQIPLETKDINLNRHG